MSQPQSEGTAPTAAGLILACTETGRVLMLQRGIDEPDDPAAGTWEFPGGNLDDGEDPFEGAKREWEEEVGYDFPSKDPAAYVYSSPNGVYQGFVVLIDDEKVVDFSKPREVANADDDYSEQAAWWQIKHAQDNPALREECKSTPWDDIAKLVPGNVHSLAAAIESEKVDEEETNYVTDVDAWEIEYNGKQYRAFQDGTVEVQGSGGNWREVPFEEGIEIFKFAGNDEE